MAQKTEIFTCDVGFLTEQSAFERAYAEVSEQRRKKTDSMRFLKDKCLSLGAELLLIYVLRKNGYDALPEIEYQSGGKPYFKALPDVHFNLSHSGSRVLCVLSEDEVGCDIEQISEIRMSIAKRYFCPEEYHCIASLPESEQTDMFFRCWVLKESFVKAVGAGLGLAFNKFCIRFEGEKITVEQSFDQNEYFFKEFNGIAGYKCAVCTRTDCGDIPLCTVDLSKFLQCRR